MPTYATTTRSEVVLGTVILYYVIYPLLENLKETSQNWFVRLPIRSYPGNVSIASMFVFL